MKAAQLLRATPSSVKTAARKVRIVEATRAQMKSGRLRLKATVSSRSRTNIKHRVVVETVKPNVDNLYNNDIRIWCDCEFFTYYGCSDVLPIYGAGFKKKATGIMPDIRNPSRVPFVCLHCVRVLNALIRNKK